MKMSPKKTHIQTTRKACQTVRCLLVVTCLLLGVSDAYAAPPANATEYVYRLQMNLDTVKRLKHYASLMNEMETIDRTVSGGPCATTADAYSAASKSRNTDKARAAFKGYELCFDAALRRSPPSHALQQMGVTTYKGLDAVYEQVLNEQFGGKRLTFSARVPELEQEIIALINKADLDVAIAVSLFKDVRIKRPSSGTWQAARQGDVLTRHTQLKTGDNSRARLEFLDRFVKLNSGPTIMNVGHNTLINLSDFKIDWEKSLREKSMMELLQGAIRVFAQGWGGRAAFSVRTGTSLCGIRGTDIEIHYDPNEDRAYYKLYKGVVEISTPYEKFTLRAGSSVTVTRGVRSEIMPIAPPS
jgi:hypothetical protein